MCGRTALPTGGARRAKGKRRRGPLEEDSGGSFFSARQDAARRLGHSVSRLIEPASCPRDPVLLSRWQTPSRPSGFVS